MPYLLVQVEHLYLSDSWDLLGSLGFTPLGSSVKQGSLKGLGLIHFSYSTAKDFPNVLAFEARLGLEYLPLYLAQINVTTTRCKSKRIKSKTRMCSCMQSRIHRDTERQKLMNVCQCSHLRLDHSMGIPSNGAMEHGIIQYVLGDTVKHQQTPGTTAVRGASHVCNSLRRVFYYTQCRSCSSQPAARDVSIYSIS